MVSFLLSKVFILKSENNIEKVIFAGKEHQGYIEHHRNDIGDIYHPINPHPLISVSCKDMVPERYQNVGFKCSPRDAIAHKTNCCVDENCCQKTQQRGLFHAVVCWIYESFVDREEIHVEVEGKNED